MKYNVRKYQWDGPKDRLEGVKGMKQQLGSVEQAESDAPVKGTDDKEAEWGYWQAGAFKKKADAERPAAA